MKHIQTFESFLNESKSSLGPKATKFENEVEGFVIPFLEEEKNKRRQGGLTQEYYDALKTLGIKEENAMICVAGDTVGDFNKIIATAKKTGLKYAEVKDSDTGENLIVFSAAQ